MILLIIIVQVSADSTYNFLSKGLADTLYCSLPNCGGNGTSGGIGNITEGTVLALLDNNTIIRTNNITWILNNQNYNTSQDIINAVNQTGLTYSFNVLWNNIINRVNGVLSIVNPLILDVNNSLTGFIRNNTDTSFTESVIGDGTDYVNITNTFLNLSDVTGGALDSYNIPLIKGYSGSIGPAIGDTNMLLIGNQIGVLGSSENNPYLGFLTVNNYEDNMLIGGESIEYNVTQGLFIFSTSVGVNGKVLVLSNLTSGDSVISNDGLFSNDVFVLNNVIVSNNITAAEIYQNGNVVCDDSNNCGLASIVELIQVNNTLIANDTALALRIDSITGGSNDTYWNKTGSTLFPKEKSSVIVGTSSDYINITISFLNFSLLTGGAIERIDVPIIEGHANTVGAIMGDGDINVFKGGVGSKGTLSNSPSIAFITVDNHKDNNLLGIGSLEYNASSGNFLISDDLQVFGNLTSLGGLFYGNLFIENGQGITLGGVTRTTWEGTSADVTRNISALNATLISSYVPYSGATGNVTTDYAFNSLNGSSFGDSNASWNFGIIDLPLGRFPLFEASSGNGDNAGVLKQGLYILGEPNNEPMIGLLSKEMDDMFLIVHNVNSSDSRTIILNGQINSSNEIEPNERLNLIVFGNITTPYIKPASLCFYNDPNKCIHSFDQINMSGTGDYVSKTGDNMTGDLNMNNANITFEKGIIHKTSRGMGVTLI